MTDMITPNIGSLLPDGYINWSKTIVLHIEQAKLHAAMKVNADLLSLYIGR